MARAEGQRQEALAQGHTKEWQNQGLEPKFELLATWPQDPELSFFDPSWELSNEVRPFGVPVLGFPKLGASFGSALPGWETLGGTGGLGGETTTLEPQAAIPASRTDIVAEDARRL